MIEIQPRHPLNKIIGDKNEVWLNYSEVDKTI